MEVYEGLIGPLEAYSLFCFLGELEWRAVEMEMETMDEGSKGASFHGGL
jgi:hypothetical protein